MPVKYTDVEIARMLEERKTLPPNYLARIGLRDKRGHRERELDVNGASGTQYRLILRQSNFNALDFSVILAVLTPGSNQWFRVRRYNGRHGEHTNPLERDTFYDFHIHQATQRYQESGAREDTFAEVTDRFADFNSALRCMFEDCGFDPPQEPQPSLFGEFGI